MKPSNYPYIVPVIELGLNSIKLNPLELQLAKKINRIAEKEKYIKTPDGWFVPISIVQDDLKTLAEFFWHETIRYGEFEIGGGFLIHADSKNILPIPYDSTFRFAMDLANSIINLKPGQKKNVAVGSQDFWILTADDINDELSIKSNKLESCRVMSSLQLLKKRFYEAQINVMNFENNIKKCMSLVIESRITPDEIDIMFGIDKIA